MPISVIPGIYLINVCLNADKVIKSAVVRKGQPSRDGGLC